MRFRAHECPAILALTLAAMLLAPRIWAEGSHRDLGLLAEAGSDGAVSHRAGSDSSLMSAFEWAWERVRENLYDRARAERYCTEVEYLRLRRAVAGVQTLDAVGRVINRFLDELGVSHTRFYTDSDLEYSLFKSMFITRQLETPKTWHIGIQQAIVGDQIVVTAIWDGSPAEAAGLRRGDIVVGANGGAFGSLTTFRGGQPARLLIARNDSLLEVDVAPIEESIHLSLYEAMRRSVLVLDVAGRRVGYVHLWAGTSPAILREFRAIIEKQLQDVAGILLDLRDGYGGAWQDYLDPFFPDRSGYFEWTVRNRDREESHFEPEFIEPHPCFSGPLVVLINEGTRSGKEALAHQFKKSKRGLLVGTTTAGSFAGGRSFFPPEEGYALYVAVHAVELDGQQIEGVGVTPDVVIEYPLRPTSSTDPQLERAIVEMRTLLEQD